MRKNPKFATFVKNKNFFLSSPSKILKFKHTKWKFYKSILQKNSKRTYFHQMNINSPNIRIWARKKNFFRVSLSLKRKFLQMFDNFIKIRFLKKNAKNCKVSKLDTLPFFRTHILRYEFNISVFLFRTHFYSSIHEAKKNITMGKVYVNLHTVSSNYMLKKGDILSFENFKFKFNNRLISNIKLFTYYPFAEIDYYAPKIVIIKNYGELSFQDACLFYPIYNDLPQIARILYKS